jgi:hypothetical protein
VFNDDYSDEEEATNLDAFRQPVSYNFNAELFDFQSFDEAIHERDEVLASEIKQYYPELSEWSQRALATAWSRFSKIQDRSPLTLVELHLRKRDRQAPGEADSRVSKATETHTASAGRIETACTQQTTPFSDWPGKEIFFHRRDETPVLRLTFPPCG